MSAAVPRTRKLNHGTNEFTQPAQTDTSAEREAPQVIEGLRVAGTDPGSTSEHGMTPLMLAASEGLAGTVQALLDRGASVNAKRSDGLNALALAAFFGHSQVVWLLLENGADLAATGRSRTQPEVWANARGFMDIGNLLREARETRLAEASSICTDMVVEAARFPGPAEEENAKDASGQEATVERKAIDDAIDSQTSLEILNVTSSEESTERRIEPTAVVARDDNPHQQPTVKESVPAPKTPPEIEDSPPLVMPQVYPASAFVAIETQTSLELDVTSSEESPARSSEPIADVWPDDNPQQQPTVNQSLPPKTLPEIEDPPPLVVPQFHPGSAFVARITSSTTTLLSLILVLLLVVSGIAAFLVPKIRKSLAAGRTEAVQKTTSLPAERSNPAVSGRNVSGTLETPPVATVESTTAPASKDVSVTAGDVTADSQRVEASSQFGSAVVSGSGSSGVVSASGSQSDASPGSSRYAGSPVAAPWRPGWGGRGRQRGASAGAKQEKVAEEQPKPAPLSMEASRSRNVVAQPVRSASEVPGSQPPPLSIISDKPKSKVIQWP